MSHFFKLLTLQILHKIYQTQIILINGTKSDAQQDLTFIEK